MTNSYVEYENPHHAAAASSSTLTQHTACDSTAQLCKIAYKTLLNMFAQQRNASRGYIGSY